MSFFDGKLDICVTAASGVEAVLKRELMALGKTPSPAEYGRIRISGDMSDVAECNLNLRTADRVYVVVGEFEAKSFDELFDNVYAVNWKDYLPKNAKIIVDAKSVNSTLFALSAIQSITKKAIVKNLCNAYSIEKLAEDGAIYHLNFNLIKDKVLILLDTSGAGLHKRGYRAETGEAPLKETLAAAIILLSVWKWDRPFLDPFTGSGTFPIEAAMIATNTAAGLNRNFAFEYWNNAPSVISKEREKAKELIIRDRTLRISGFDINPDTAKLAMRHAELAGVKDYVHIQAADMRTLSSRYSYGVMFANPPYGERLMTEKEVAALMKDFGKTFRSFKEWSLYAITAFSGFERAFGARADKVRKLYSANLECNLYRYLGKAPSRQNS